ncbi:MAG: alpha/beta hydrolase [Alphaproteobacteria bacterium]
MRPDPGLEVIVRQPAGSPHPVPLLFVHGAFAGAWCWDEHFLPWFAGRGYTAQALSLRGHGRSPGDAAQDGYRIADYVDDLARVISGIRAATGGPPILIGHSMGGFVVQKYLERAAVPAVVLLAPVPPSGLGGPSAMLAWWRPQTYAEIASIQMSDGRPSDARALHDALFTDVSTPSETMRHFVRMRRESNAATMDMLGADLVDSSRIAAIPTLVLSGARDALIPPAFVRATARRYGVTAEIMPDLPHGLMLDPRWERVAERVAEWLDVQGF